MAPEDISGKQPFWGHWLVISKGWVFLRVNKNKLMFKVNDVDILTATTERFKRWSLILIADLYKTTGSIRSMTSLEDASSLGEVSYMEIRYKNLQAFICSHNTQCSFCHCLSCYDLIFEFPNISFIAQRSIRLFGNCSLERLWWQTQDGQMQNGLTKQSSMENDGQH